MDVHVFRIEPQHLGHEIGEDRVGALADIGGAAEHGDAAAAVGAQHDAGVRHAVPVDRRARPGHVRRARDADAAPAPRLPEWLGRLHLRGGAIARRLVAPAGGLDHLVDALAEPDGRHREVVRRLRERLDEYAAPHVGGIEAELLGRLVQLHLEREARLWCAVTALGSARRLVGEDPRALELVDRHLVGHRIDDAGVERRGHAVGAVGAAVEPRLQMAAGDVPRPREARLDPHQHRVAAAMDVEHFLPRARDLHRAADELREAARRDLVGEGVELAAEAATHRRRDDADVRGRHVEDLGEQAVHVVGRLRRGPQRQLAVGGGVRHRGVLLHRQVRVALVEEDVLAHEIGGGEGRLHVAELQRDVLVHVGSVAVLVDAHLGVRERLLDGHQRGQRLVVDVDEAARAVRRLLVHRRHRADGVADHPHLLRAERLLVLRHGKDAELHARQVRPGDDGVHARHRPGAGGVDTADACMRVRTAQQFAERHAGQDEVVGVARVPGDLAPGIDLRQRLADHAEALGHSYLPSGRLRRADSLRLTSGATPCGFALRPDGRRVTGGP